jgi:hypothetical protein
MQMSKIKLIAIVVASLPVFAFLACTRGFQVKFDSASLNSGFGISPEVYQNNKLIYDNNCSACHGPLDSSTKKNKTAAEISYALKTQPAMSSVAKVITPEDVLKLELILSSTLVVIGPDGLPATCNANLPEFVNVQRLNKLEYNNVIRDLTGLDLKPADSFPSEGRGKTFSNTALAQTVDITLAQMYFDSAIKVLDSAFASARQNIVTCDPNAAAGHRACADKIIKEFGFKAFRRPLTAVETNQFLARYDATRTIFPAGTTASIFDESLKASLQTILIAPAFLFRIMDRPGTNDSLSKDLSAYELASRLSFFIWGSIPDSALFAAAMNGSLLGKPVLVQQVDRMLKDPKAVHMVDGFAMQWLGLDALSAALPNKTTFPEFTENLRAAMFTESRMLLADIIQRDASPYLLLNSTYTYLNAELARHYGMSGPATGFAKMDISATSRRGIFGHGSLLTVNSRETETSIVKRGLYILNTFLCINPGSPPPEATTEAPPAASLAGLNPRRRLEAHVANPKCVSCHSQMDPPGFALENYNAVGKYRTQYGNGDAIDSLGNFPTGEVMSNPAEVGQTLQNSVLFKNCFSRHLMTYALGRDLYASDKCAADKLGSLNLSKDKKFSDLVKEIVISPQFMRQKGSN